VAYGCLCYVDHVQVSSIKLLSIAIYGFWVSLGGYLKVQGFYLLQIRVRYYDFL
jgi:hypothetical protein